MSNENETNGNNGKSSSWSNQFINKIQKTLFIGTIIIFLIQRLKERFYWEGYQDGINNGYATAMSSDSENDLENDSEIIEMPTEYYKNRVKFFINLSRKANGKKEIGNDEPIYRKSLNDSTFFGDVYLHLEFANYYFNNRLAMKDFYTPNGDYFEKANMPVLREFGTFQTIKADNLESLKNFFENTENKLINSLLISDISSGQEVEELISFLLRQHIVVKELAITVNEELALGGNYIEYLSNIPGLESLYINNNCAVPINGYNLGKRNPDFRTLELLNCGSYQAFGTIYLDSKEMADLRNRNIKVINYNYLNGYRNFYDQSDEIQNAIDECVKELNSRYDFSKLNRREKVEKIVEYIKELYTYSKEFKAERDESKKKLLEKYIFYYKSLFAPLINGDIDKTNGEHNALCGNFAALCTVLCERILGEGSVLCVNDIESQHVYCLIQLNENGNWAIVDPTFSNTYNVFFVTSRIDNQNYYKKAIRVFDDIMKNKRKNDHLDTIRANTKSIREELREWSMNRLLNKAKSYNNPNAMQREGLIDKLRVPTEGISPPRNRYNVIPQSDGRGK